MALAAFVLATVVLVARRFLLLYFARLFLVHDPAPSDALVVLASRSAQNARVAAELYQRRLAGTILLMCKPPSPFPDLNPSEVSRLVLVRGGVPAAAIQMLPAVGFSESTREEAGRMREYARRKPLRRITVVADASRTARVRRAFREALRGMGVEVRMAAVRSPDFDESNWYTRDEGIVEYFRETVLVGYSLVVQWK